jgi:hypothetical protein
VVGLINNCINPKLPACIHLRTGIVYTAQTSEHVKLMDTVTKPIHVRLPMRD